MEVGVLGPSEGGEWEQWQLDDTARAELPFSASGHETLPVGIALETSTQHNLPWGENQHLPAMPLLLLLSHEGLLSLFWVLNLLPGAATICSPPNPLQDTSGLHLFTSKNTEENLTKVASTEAQVEEKPTILSTPPQSQPLAFVPPSTAASPQWQVPPPSSPAQPTWSTPLSAPKPESKPVSNVSQGSWLASSTSSPTTLIPSLQQSTSPATPSVTTPVTAPPVFGAIQSSALFSKPGAFSLSPTSVTTSSSLTKVPVLDAVQTSQPKADLPIVPCAEPSSQSILSIPEQVSDESQELKAINEALIEDAMREEIDLFNWELEQLNQKVHSININVINTQSLEKITHEVESLRAFMQELKETTQIQETEVDSLRNFLLEAFSYIESLKLRIRLQNNPDYISIQSPQGLDPIQSQKMADIKSNLRFVEAQLKRLNSEVADQWNLFQESNKENRETMQIPSLETIYQAMVVHNSVMMRQKSLIDELEVKAMAHSRNKLLNLLSVSQIIDDSHIDINDTELSKIAKDFLSLNLNRLKKDNLVEDIEESMSSLEVSGCDFTLPRFNNPQSKIYSDKMALLQEGFDHSPINYLDFSKSSEQTSMFPISASSARLGSISSGQPVMQNITEITSTLKEDNKLNSARASSQLSFSKEQESTPGKTPLASKFSPSSSTLSLNFEVAPPPSHTASVDLSSTAPKVTQYLPQNLQTSGFNTNITTKSISMTSEANSPFIFSTNTVPQVVSTPQTKSVAATTSSTKGLSFIWPTTTNTQAFSVSSPRTFGSSVFSPQATSSSPFQQLSTNFGKSPSFTSVVTTSTPSVAFTFTSTFNKIEQSNTVQTSATAPLNPLASLNSLVSGIEPLKPFIQESTPSKESAVSNNTNTPPQASQGQPTLFKNPNANDGGNTNLQKNVFNVPLEIKQKLSESETVTSNMQTVEAQSKFGGEFKSFSFGLGSQKPIFSNTPPSTPPKASLPSTEKIQTDQSPNNMLSLQKSPSTGAFSVTTFAAPVQKTTFDETGSSTTSSEAPTSLEVLAEAIKTLDNTTDDVSTSTIIEVNLSPSKSVIDTNTCLEKLSGATNITVTKIDPVETKSVDQTKPQGGSSSTSLFSSFSLNSPSTPTKLSPSIFGGSSTIKPSVSYEIVQCEPKSSEVEKKEENKSEIKETHEESPKPQNLVADASLSTKPTNSFSFSVSTLQSSPTTSENAQPVSSGLSFGMTLPTPTSVSASIPGEQTISTFSFAQPTTTSTTSTQPSSTAFSFAITTAPSTTSSTFSFGNLSLFTENKPKSEFSFGLQDQPSTTTSSSIFSGFSSKPTDTSTIFGGSTTEENKNTFGQVTSSAAENKSVFGQPVSTDGDTQKGFSFSLSLSTTASQSSLFGSTTTTAASFFGQPICSPTSTTSTAFGQPNSTSVFGSATSSPFSGTSGFGSKSTFGQSGGSFFGQSSTFGSSGGSLFGGASPSIGTGSTVFGSSTSQPPSSPFGQSSGGNGVMFGGGSFSAGGQSIGQAGFGSPAFQNKPAFASSSPPAFGSAPAFGGAATFGGSPSFGSPGKLFGSPTSSQPSVFGGGTQQSSTFENLANQNTMTFGNIAQNQSPGFSQTQTAGFGFASTQGTPSSPGFPPPSNTNSGTSFGGSSFSSWR